MPTTTISVELAEAIERLLWENSQLDGLSEESYDIYVRLSEDRFEDKTGNLTQLEDCFEMARYRRKRIAKVNVDVESAWREDVTREDYEHMLRRMSSGRTKGVIVWKLDRLVRRNKEFERFWDICTKAGCQLLLKVENIDTTSEYGPMILRLLTSVAEIETTNTSQRQKRKHEYLAAHGRWKGGGLRAFGYTQNMVEVVPDERDLLLNLATRYIAQETLADIARDWKARGIRKPVKVTAKGREIGGGPFRVLDLGRLLDSPRIAGMREHHGVVVSKGTWEAIWDEETWLRIRTLREAEKVRRGPNLAVAKYLLSGDEFGACGECGHQLYGAAQRVNGADRTTPSYRCSSSMNDGCGRVYIVAEPAEEALVGMVIDHLRSTPGLAEALEQRREVSDQQVLVLVERIKNDRLRVRELLDQWTDGDLTRDEHDRARRRLRERIELNQQLLAEYKRPAIEEALENLDQLEALWDEKGIDWRRELLRSVVERVLITKARYRGRFDPERVVPVYRPELKVA